MRNNCNMSIKNSINNHGIISERSRSVEWSGIRTVSGKMNKIKNNGISLGVGQPDFDTPLHIRQAANAALDQGFTRYPPSKGFSDLIQVISEKLKRKNKISADPESEIFISVGAMQAIFNALLILVNPGDEVIVIEPGFNYNSQIRVFGGIPVPVIAREDNGYTVDPQDIRRAITPKTRLIIINSPTNPTGAIYSRDVLTDIAKIAQEYGIFILSDEAYEDIVFDVSHHSIASIDGMQDLAISVFTLSKSYAMTGWRVGYVAAKKEIIAEMEKLMEHMLSGVTAVSQRAAIEALQGPQDCITSMVNEYKERRELICSALDRIEGVSYFRPAGTFYVYPNISGTGMKSIDFVDYMINTQKVGTIPGNTFSCNGMDHIRLSFATSRENIIEGLSRINEGVNEIRSMKERNPGL